MRRRVLVRQRPVLIKGIEDPLQSLKTPVPGLRPVRPEQIKGPVTT